MAGSPILSHLSVFFISDSTGISAETMGNALLLQFPGLMLERHLVPFIATEQEVDELIRRVNQISASRNTLIFSTIADEALRGRLHTAACPVIDLFELGVGPLEHALGRSALRQAGRLHGIGDAQRYNARIAAVEFTLEHDDGQSLRALEKADLILLAPSRCGKTPTGMYLALQHGLKVANYPLLEDDLRLDELPRPVRHLKSRCWGMLTTPQRLAQVRGERRPHSKYSSLEQCRWELRRAEQLFHLHGIRTVNSSAKSVEEMSSEILQHLSRAASNSMQEANR